MTDEVIRFKRDDDSYITLEELEDRCIKYVRNIRLGFQGIRLSLDQLKTWLRLDARLVEFPDDILLQKYLSMTTMELAEWSWNNDFHNTRSRN